VDLSAERGARIFAAEYGELIAQQDTLRTCRMLFVDDVGTEKRPSAMQHMLIELLESRKSQRRRTVMTTNASVKLFNERYGDVRLDSRMSGWVHWVGSKGPDLRRRS
jgi:DNA replication protein DnaC